MLRAAAVAIATAAVCTAAAGAATSEPVLQVTGRAPLVIEGRGFDAGQAVRVTVQLRRLDVVKTPRADATGRFRTTVTRIRLTGAQRCAAGLVISARSPGALVLWHPRGLPDCPEPLRPPSV
jgi:hypothetical protein